MPASFKINETTITQTIDDPWLKSKGIELLVKRDDLLHPLINGNKWRKLKYNLLQMQSQNKTELLTFGGAFSNHIHACAAAGKIFGLKTHGIIRGPNLDLSNPTIQFAQQCGMQLHVVNRIEYKLRNDSQYLAELQEKFGFSSVMQVPQIEKITLNMGVGEALADKKILDHAVADLTAISGQKPLITKARKSVAGFKVREGYPIGCKVTLRGERMWDFFERLVSIAIPRIRDFRGVSAKSFDGRGNYSMGVREQIIFPEIDYDKVDRVRGMDITITTSAKSDEEGRALLEAFNFPFKK